MEFRVLGPLEVIHDGRAVPVRGSRRRLLLATLLVHRNLVVSVDRLVDVLFADDPPDRAVSTVQSYVSRLRRDLGGSAAPLDTRPGGYVLVVDADDVDAVRFERRVNEAAAVLAIRCRTGRRTRRRGVGMVARSRLRRVLRRPVAVRRANPSRRGAPACVRGPRGCTVDARRPRSARSACWIGASPTGRFGSGSGLSTCSRCTEAAGIPRRCARTTGSVTSWATSWGSNRPLRWPLLEAKILRHDASLDSPDADAARSCRRPGDGVGRADRAPERWHFRWR